MAERWEGEEFTLDIPANLLKTKTGFAIDFGGSMIKFVYATHHGDTVRLHFLRYAADRIKEAFTDLAGRLKGGASGGKVYTCGLGCNEHSQYIQDLLKCQMVNVMETDCFVDAFQFLVNTFPLEQIVHPESPAVTEYSEKMANSFANAQYSFATTFKDSCRGEMWESSIKRIEDKKKAEAGDGSVTDSKNIPESEKKVVYPTILFLSGSAGSPIKVKADGGYLCLDVISTCGKTLLALGSLLTGAKTFEELVTLAQKGSLDNMDITGRILKMKSADVYASLSSEFTAFAFGQAVAKDLADFSREDVALGLISMMVRVLVDSYHNWALITGVQQVFFCGGIHATSDLVREMMGKYFECKSKMNPLGKETEHYFLKHGSYLGALGSLLKTLNTPPS